MSKLRKNIQQNIIDTLDSSTFTSDDFEIFFGNEDDDEYLISLTFKYDERFKFFASEEINSGLMTYIVERTPGQIKETEKKSFRELKTAIKYMLDWCNEIRSELKVSTPIFREMDELKSTLYEHLKGKSESDEFTAEEINKLKEQFEALTKRVDELEKTNLITQSQSGEFKQGIEQVTQDIESYTKETWLKTASNKITKLIANLGKSPEGRKMIADSARKLIGLD